MEISCFKTKIEALLERLPSLNRLQVVGNFMEVIGNSEHEVLPQIAIAPDCIKSIYRGIWS